MNSQETRKTTMFSLKSVLVLAAFAAVAAAHAQTLFATGFEPPIYTNGVSAAGVQGWIGAGISPKVTNSLASQGSQSLQFAETNWGALENGLAFGSTGKFTITADVRLAGNSGAGRIASLRLIDQANSYYGTELSIDGSGTVRASGANGGSMGGVASYAAPGSYLDRWLRFTLAYDPLAGKTDWRISRFGAGQADLSGSFNYDLDNVYMQLESFNNSAATATSGSVYFDNINVVGPNPVPEPASMVALGLGAFGILRKRRK